MPPNGRHRRVALGRRGGRHRPSYSHARPGLAAALLPLLAAALLGLGGAPAAARTIEIVLDLHMCSAQPFLQRYVQQFADTCRDKKDDAFWVVELWDGSVISSKQFLERVASKKKLFGEKGRWHPNEDVTRMEFVPTRHGVLGKQAVTKSLKLRHPTDLECAVHKLMLKDDATLENGPARNVQHAEKVALHKIVPRKGLLNLDVRHQENSKDIKRIKDVVRQLVGVSMLAAAQAAVDKANSEIEDESEQDADIDSENRELEADMLQAFKMLDIYDSGFLDSAFTKFKNWFSSEQESSAGREIFKGGMGVVQCAIAAFSASVSDECAAVLSTMASVGAAKIGLGTASTYRIRALVDFVNTYQTTLEKVVLRLDGEARSGSTNEASREVHALIDTATAQVQCVLNLFGVYFDFKSPVTVTSPDGEKFKYKVSLGRSKRGFASEQLLAYSFKENIELTEAMIGEIEHLQDTLSRTLQLMELHLDFDRASGTLKGQRQLPASVPSSSPSDTTSNLIESPSDPKPGLLRRNNPPSYMAAIHIDGSTCLALSNHKKACCKKEGCVFMRGYCSPTRKGHAHADTC
jgi:hypothetical protein